MKGKRRRQGEGWRAGEWRRRQGNEKGKWGVGDEKRRRKNTEVGEWARERRSGRVNEK